MLDCKTRALGWGRRASRWGVWLGIFVIWGMWLVGCSPGPVTEQVTSDAADAKVATEPTPEPVVEPATEPASEPASEPKSEPGQESVLEPASERSGPDDASEPSVEPGLEAGDEPEPQVDGGGLEDVPEATVEQKPELPPGACQAGEVRSCYAGSPATRNKGNCQDGQQVCSKGQWGPCLNSVLPQTETCDGRDNDCNGTVDDNCCSPFQHAKTWFASRAEVADIAFSPNGQNVAVAYSDAYTRVWRLSDYRLLARYNFVSLFPARSVDWSPDSKTLVASGEGNYFRIREIGSSSYQYTFQGHSSYVTHVRFSPDGKYIASGGADATVRLWEVSSGKQVRLWNKHKGPISGLSFSPDSKHVVSASDDKILYVWSIASNNPALTLKGHTDYVTDVWYSPDGKLIASCSFDKQIRLWSAKDGKLVRTIMGHQNFITSIAFSPDSQSIASTAYKEQPRLWNVSDSTLIRPLSMYGKGLDVNVIRFHPQGRMIASGGAEGKVKLWNAARDLRLHEGLGPEISAVAIHPTQPWIALGRDNTAVQIWNHQTGTFIKGLSEHVSYLRAMFFTKDGKFLVTAAYDGYIKWWNTQTWAQVRSVDVSSPRRAIRWMEPVPGGKYLVTVSDERRLRVWNLANGQLYKLMGTASDARTTTMYSVAAHYQGDLIATGASSADPTIRIWSLKANKIVRVLQGHRSTVLALSFHPKNDMLASAGSSDRTIRLWNAATGQSQGILLTGGTGENMLNVRYSPDGKWLAALAEYGTVYVFETQSYKQIAKLTLQASYVFVLEWSPDSKRLFVTTREGFVNAWNVTGKSCGP